MTGKVTVEFTREWLTAALKHENEDIPDDATIGHVVYNPDRDMNTVVVESDELPTVNEGGHIPRLHEVSDDD